MCEKRFCASCDRESQVIKDACFQCEHCCYVNVLDEIQPTAAGVWNYNLDELPKSGVFLFHFEGACMETETYTAEGFRDLLTIRDFRNIAWAPINLPTGKK